MQNTTSHAGGGIACYYSNPLIKYCTIKNNVTTYGHGGGIYCEYASPTIENSIIMDNYSGNAGGGIGCFMESSPNIVNNIISDNVAEVGGGGIGAFHESNFTSINNLIINNESLGSYGGGGISILYNTNPTFINNTICYNTSYGEGGGGLFCNENSNPVIFNTIIYDNTCSGYPEYNEVFLRAEAPCIAYIYSSNIDSAECSMQPTSFIQWISLIDTLPGFSDPLCHLSSSSPCIDAGNESTYVIHRGLTIFAPTDGLDGNPRPSCSDYDIGCYEVFRDTCCMPSNPSPSNGEFDIPTSLTFSWDCLGGCSVQTYNLYLGTDSPPPLHSAGIIADSFVIVDIESNETYYWSVTSDCGSSTSDGPIWYFSTIALDIKKVYNEPNDFFLFLHPNPFNSTCRIEAPTGASVKIFDLLGNVVMAKQSTKGTFLWQPDEAVGSGVYLVRARLGEQVVSKKVLFLK